MLKRSFVTATVLLFSVMGFQRVVANGIHRHDVSAEAHRDLARADAYESVCRIEKNDSPSDSCVLIAPNWVLTAGHTVHLAKDQQLSVIFDDSLVYSVEEREIRFAALLREERSLRGRQIVLVEGGRTVDPGSCPGRP